MPKDFSQNNPGRYTDRPEKKFEERILNIRRVSKKTTGGNYISFSALVAIGDGKGKVGVGIGRGLEVPPAIQKAISQAKKHMVQFPSYKETLPHQILLKYKAARILLKPAPPGTGLKVGGVVRVILDLAGVNNASGKIIGTRNQITNAYAVIEAIKRLKPKIVYEEHKVESKEEKMITQAVQPVVVEAKPAEVKEAVPEKKTVKKTRVKKATASKKADK